MKIHPTAIIDPKAELDSSVEVGPYSLVGGEVRVDAGTTIGAHATLEGPSTIGRDNKIFNYAVLGTDSQDGKYEGARTHLKIGDRNTIREYASINRATEEGASTVIGDDNKILAYSHIAHNCSVGSRVVMSNVASLAGHVLVEDDAILGGLVAVHQFCRIGRHALIGAGAKVVKDIPPYCLADGVPARLAGINTIGLRRHGVDHETINALRHAFSRLFRMGGNLGRAIESLSATDGLIEEQRLLLDFIRESRRGMARIRRGARQR